MGFHAASIRPGDVIYKAWKPSLSMAFSRCLALILIDPYEIIDKNFGQMLVDDHFLQFFQLNS